MYYAHSCSYCTKVFYTYQDRKEDAAKILYTGIKKHLIEYDEDHKEFKFDDGVEVDTNEVYYELTEHIEPPSGGYEL